jgi:hypothetical protein
MVRGPGENGTKQLAPANVSRAALDLQQKYFFGSFGDESLLVWCW